MSTRRSSNEIISKINKIHHPRPRNTPSTAKTFSGVCNARSQERTTAGRKWQKRCLYLLSVRFSRVPRPLARCQRFVREHQDREARCIRELQLFSPQLSSTGWLHGTGAPKTRFITAEGAMGFAGKGSCDHRSGCKSVEGFGARLGTVRHYRSGTATGESSPEINVLRPENESKNVERQDCHVANLIWNFRKHVCLWTYRRNLGWSFVDR